MISPHLHALAHVGVDHAPREPGPDGVRRGSSSSGSMRDLRLQQLQSQPRKSVVVSLTREPLAPRPLPVQTALAGGSPAPSETALPTPPPPMIVRRVRDPGIFASGISQARSASDTPSSDSEEEANEPRTPSDSDSDESGDHEILSRPSATPRQQQHQPQQAVHPFLTLETKPMSTASEGPTTSKPAPSPPVSSQTERVPPPPASAAPASAPTSLADLSPYELQLYRLIVAAPDLSSLVKLMAGVNPEAMKHPVNALAAKEKIAFFMAANGAANPETSSTASAGPKPAASSTTTPSAPAMMPPLPTTAHYVSASPPSVSPATPDSHASSSTTTTSRPQHHRRSLSANSHGHFTLGRGPPTLSEAAFASDAGDVVMNAASAETGKHPHLLELEQTHGVAGSSSDTPSSRRSRGHRRQLSAPVIGLTTSEPSPTMLLHHKAGSSVHSSVDSGNELRIDSENIVVTKTGTTSIASPNGGGASPSSLSYSHARRDSLESVQPSLFNREELETIRVVGKGTVGVVTMCLHVRALKIVAVKSLAAQDPTKRESSVAELKALHRRMIPFTSSTTSPRSPTSAASPSPSAWIPTEPSCVVGFYDAFLSPDGASICLVLEWMDGGSLQDIVDDAKSNHKTLPESFTAVACLSMLRGLVELHRERLLHRDLKPANVLVSRRGDIKLSDFGVSIAFGMGSVSRAKTFVGSLSYMAPERVHSEAETGYSYAADLWAVGLIAYVCATGEYPFTQNYEEGGYWGMVEAITEDPSPKLSSGDFDEEMYQDRARGSEREEEEGAKKQRRVVSPELADFVAKCLVKDPKRRATAQELLEHPFLSDAKRLTQEERASIVAAQLSPVDPVAARKDLDRLLGIAAEYHTKRAFELGHTLPRVSSDRIAGLAQDLNVKLSAREVAEITESLNNAVLFGSNSGGDAKFDGLALKFKGELGDGRTM